MPKYIANHLVAHPYLVDRGHIHHNQLVKREIRRKCKLHGRPAPHAAKEADEKKQFIIKMVVLPHIL